MTSAADAVVGGFAEELVKLGFAGELDKFAFFGLGKPAVPKVGGKALGALKGVAGPALNALFIGGAALGGMKSMGRGALNERLQQNMAGIR